MCLRTCQKVNPTRSGTLVDQSYGPTSWALLFVIQDVFFGSKCVSLIIIVVVRSFFFFAVFVLCPLGSASCCDIGWFGFCVEFVFVGNLLGQVILWCCWRKILLHPISSRGCCSQRLVYWRTRALKPKFSNIAEFRIRTRDQLLSLLRKARSLKPESFPRVK